MRSFGDDGGVVAIAARQPIGAAWWRFVAEKDPGYGLPLADVPDLSVAVVVPGAVEVRDGRWFGPRSERRRHTADG